MFFLRRPTDDGKRPHGAVAMINLVNAQHGEVVRETVVAQVIAERALRFLRRINHPGDDKVGVGIQSRSAVCRGAKRMRSPARAPAKVNSGRPSGKGITAASVIAGWPPTKMLTRKGSPRRIASV